MAVSIGEPAPLFYARSNVNPNFFFGSAAGRYLVLTFLDSSTSATGAALLAGLAIEAVFDAVGAALFVVAADEGEAASPLWASEMAGIKVFLDDGKIARLYGVEARGAAPVSVVVSPRQQVIGIVHGDPGTHAERVLAILRAAPHPQRLEGVLAHPPILMIPHIFEPELCRALIDGYDEHGGAPSGFMRDVDGRTVEIADRRFKVRRDWMVERPELKAAIQERFIRRVVPEIAKYYQFGVTRMERYLVACYEADDGGHFNAHRDNTTLGTAHRRFAVSLNLNAEAFEGGDLRLPEFGPQTYRPPTGGGIVFSCSMLHEALPVTRGRRYAFLPFLYDEAARSIRDANLRHVGGREGERVLPS